MHTQNDIHKTRKLCYRKDDRAMRAIEYASKVHRAVDREPLRRYGHSKLSKMADGWRRPPS